MADSLRQELIDLAHALAEASPEALCVAQCESAAGGTTHFLKLNGQRHGYDLEAYCVSAEVAEGWQGILYRFLKEVVLPLESAAPEAYKVACEKLIEMGRKVYPADFQPAWEEVLTPLTAS